MLSRRLFLALSLGEFLFVQAQQDCTTSDLECCCNTHIRHPSAEDNDQTPLQRIVGYYEG
jgi:hypothetical protein